MEEIAMQHTYVFQPGKWRVTGTYYNQDSNPSAVYGETEILHLSGQWVLDGFMDVKSEPPVRLMNKYAIAPPAAKELFVSWVSQSPAFGKLIGKFIIEDEAIISLYTSEDHKYSGAEFLYYVNAGEYTGRGYFFQGEKKTGSWEVKLIHVD
jgi:hypothetical protein